MNKATIIKREQVQLLNERKERQASVEGRPTRKDSYVLELILTTFGAPNVIKAIAQMSGNLEVMQFAGELPKLKQTDSRLEVCGQYKVFLQSFVSDCGAVIALQTLLRACGNRVYINQQTEKTRVFVKSWLATKRVIHMTIAAMQSEGKGEV